MTTPLPTNPTVIIGAGPYGLSAAAHLRGRRLPVLVVGKPMEFWANMPAGMYLKSPWSASSLSDPRGTLSLDRFSQLVKAAPAEPIPLGYFLEYARWFARHAVPDVDETSVRRLSRKGATFRLELGDGRLVDTGRVVVAVGIHPFAHVPDFAGSLPSGLASHSGAHHDFSSFFGRTVVVVGSGQSALECAALLNEAGARVELIARGPVHWVNRKLYDLPGPARRIFYPPTDVGPPGINWLVAFPLLMRHVPVRLRAAMHRRTVRPAGAKWLRPRVEGRVRITPNTAVIRADRWGEGVRLQLSDGTTREVDHLLMGTGYRPDIERMAFIDPSLRRLVQTRNGFPILNRWFESSVPGLHFVGGAAGHSFGPLCNFVAGAGVAARQIAERASGRT
jgi:cation diffusion facilitator CzcD-associated flavoprotein CzcO